MTEAVEEEGDEDALLLRGVFDAHSHVHLDSSSRDAAATCGALLRSGVMATRESDWAALEELAGADVPVELGFGLHPWWAREREPGWGARLRAVLRRHPAAIVGEIGLDKLSVKRAPARDWEHQVEAFEEAMNIAAEMRRAACLHVVRAWGYLIDECLHKRAQQRGQLPPRLLLHSFSGSPETARRISVMMADAGACAYFGFSWSVNGAGDERRRERVMETIRSVPATRLVLESDLSTARNVRGDLRRGLALVAEARGWTLAEAVKRTAANAEEFFGAAHARPSSPPSSPMHDTLETR